MQDLEGKGPLRYARQNKIAELILNNEIDTQEKLAELLKKSGYDVTQATVSRDIRELQLIKTPASSGQYKYAMPEQAARKSADRFTKVFKDTVQSVDHSGNLIVIKTLTGCANAACEAIDSLDFLNIIGTVAGDNTVLVVCDDKKNVASLTARFKELLNE